MGVPINPEHYIGLLTPANNEGYDDLDPKMDILLVKAWQRVESELTRWTEEKLQRIKEMTRMRMIV